MNKPEFYRELFHKLESTDLVGRYVIFDFFSLTTIQLLEDYNRIDAGVFSILLHEFQDKCRKIESLEKYDIFFFTLANLIENKESFIYGDIETKKTYLKHFVETMQEVVR